MSQVKLQFACGENRIEGWENHDSDVDLTKLPLSYPDNHADIILVEHFVEHITSRQGVLLIDELRRILKPGGVLRVCVPVVGTHLQRAHARDLLINHGHCQGMSRNLLLTMLWASGFELQNIKETKRRECDGHWKIIGEEKDDIETLRMEAIK